MKKLFLIAALASTILSYANVNPNPNPTAISDKVLSAFKETFKSATEITWHEFTNYYQANFKVAKIQVRAHYSEDGQLLKTIRYYDEDNLMPNIVASLKKRFKGKTIHNVTETSSPNQIDYVINLKDGENWYIVHSDMYGNLQLVTKFKRGEI